MERNRSFLDRFRRKFGFQSPKIMLKNSLFFIKKCMKSLDFACFLIIFSQFLMNFQPKTVHFQGKFAEKSDEKDKN